MLVKQVEYGMEFTFLYFEIVIAGVCYELTQVTVFFDLISVSNDKKSGLGARNSYIQQIWIVREFTDRIVYHTHDDIVAFPTLIFMYGACDFCPELSVDGFGLVAIWSNNTDRTIISQVG